MSMTDDLACRDCREKLWVGQGGRLYGDSLDELNAFLEAHKHHRLEYGYFDDGDAPDPVMKYKEFKCE